MKCIEDELNAYLNKDEFASRLNYPYHKVLQWVNGEKCPSEEELEKVSSFFNVRSLAMLYTIIDIKKMRDNR